MAAIIDFLFNFRSDVSFSWSAMLSDPENIGIAAEDTEIHLLGSFTPSLNVCKKKMIICVLNIAVTTFVWLNSI